MSELSIYLTAQKKQYLVGTKETGGRASGFRRHIGDRYSADPQYFGKMVLDALMEAATHKWEQQPRKSAPDLFAINGYEIPEFLTRPTAVPSDDEDEDEAEQFEKVDHQFATVNDLYADATLKMRKAAQSSAAAEAEMRAADNARRRARGNLAAYLRDLADAAGNQAA
jgi:hypothetical protein